MEIIAWFMVAAGAVAQAFTGFGFSLVSAPFLIAAYEAPLGIQLNLVLSVLLNVGVVVVGRRTTDLRSAGTLLGPAAIATVVVGLVVRNADTHGLTVVAGTLCLLGTVAIWSGASFGRIRGPGAMAMVGAASGAMNVTAGIGGPPVVLFSVRSNWSPAVARSTLGLFFLGINAVAIVTLGLPDSIPGGLVIAVCVGFVIGRQTAARLEADRLRTLTLVLAAAGSVLAVARGLS